MKSGESMYYLLIDDQKTGPFSGEELRRQLADKTLQDVTPACRAGESAWQPVGALLESAAAPKTPPRSLLNPLLAWGGLLLGLITSILLKYVPQWFSASGSITELVVLGGMTLLLLSAGVVGAVFGVLDMGTPGRRVSASLAFAGNLLILFFAVIWMSARMPEWKGKLEAVWPRLKGRPTYVSRESIRAVPDAAKKVVPSGRLQAEERAHFRSMWEQEFLTVFRRAHPGDLPWKKDAEELVMLWSEQYPLPPVDPPSERMFALSQSILQAGCEDPLVLTFCARSQFELGEATRLAKLAKQKIGSVPYPRRMDLILHIYLASQYVKENNVALNSIEFKLATDDVLQLLEEKTDDVQAAWLLDYLERGDANDVFKDRGRDICERAEKKHNFPGWACDVLWGEYWTDQAWAARGTGYADTVSAAGWNNFYKYLGQAAQSFQKSWQANPADPRAAASMIRISMGSPGDSSAEMRVWFERAIKARFDYAPAYSSMLWGLRPRWSGSHEAMLAFGEECLKTGRFDTTVPLEYLRAIQGIMSDLNGDTRIFQAAQVNRDFHTMVEGYIKDKNSAFKPEYARSLGLLAEYYGGHYDTARQMLALNHYTMEHDAAVMFDVDEHMMPKLVCMQASAARVPYLKSYSARTMRQPDLAEKYLQEAVKLAAGDRQVSDYLADELASLHLEKQLLTHQWVPFMPDPDFKGWEILAGKWKVNPDGSLEATADKNGTLIRSQALVGSYFSIRGEVEFVSSDTGDFQAGIVFGQPDMGRPDWTSFRIKNTRKEGKVAYFSRHFTKPKTAYPADVRTRNIFSVEVQGDMISAEVNGHMVGTGTQQLREDHVGLSREALVGMGGYSDQNNFTVRYRNVEIMYHGN